MKTALYARVSTSDKGQDPALQLTPLRQYATLRGWTVTHEYVDSGVSGAKRSRPKLDELMQDAEAGAFEGVLVWKFDRFARSTTHLLDALQRFRENKIAFVSMTEGIDTSSAMGEFVFTVLGAVAQLERSLIIERTRAGMANAKAKGIHCGRPRKLHATAK